MEGKGVTTSQSGQDVMSDGHFALTRLHRFGWFGITRKGGQKSGSLRKGETNLVFRGVWPLGLFLPHLLSCQVLGCAFFFRHG